jgi:plastocyanin
MVERDFNKNKEKESRIKPVFWVFLIILILIIVGILIIYLVINIISKDNPNLHKSTVTHVLSDISIYYVDIRDYGFFPEELKIRPGESVVWKNLGYENHTVSFEEINISSGVLMSGENYTKIFDNEGVFNYNCLINPDLRGRMIVSSEIQV